ncbi:probable RNA-binding protein EIF1AD [Galleria mellonella]|uniref:Probable RNA-binding protein EIF1AD n=1 Tax=Galleria mellonella TaxID=7137 RepID=A0A6J1WVM0_GALME|nr:probable RNA-binding protein EIF1AD [Galleria mellonella]XP_052749887.1 probable RNA-binding protein EIF1AD [Galleria mellonella]
MSRVNKRKHVINEAIWDDYILPNENQSIVKVLKSKGNNLHQVITPNGEEFLVSMPNKFRKNIWVKRGNYILVEPILEGNKVKGEIVKIMNKKSIKFYKESNVWPKEFDEPKKVENNTDDDEIFVNTNWKKVHVYESDSDSSEDSDSSDHSDSSEECDSSDSQSGRSNK